MFNAHSSSSPLNFNIHQGRGCRVFACLERWGTVAEIVHDLEHQGFAVETHSVRRDMKALLETYPQRKFNVNSNGYGEEKYGLAQGYCRVGKDGQMLDGITLPEA